MLTILCLSGLFAPKLSMYVGFINAFTKIVYTVMYLKFGSDSRVLASVSGNLPLYGLAWYATYLAVVQCLE